MNKFKLYLESSSESRKRIKQFDKEFYSYSSGSDIGLRIAAYFMDGCAIFLMFFPFQEVLKDRFIFFFVGMFFGLSTLYYTQSYLQYRDEQKQKSIYQIIRYLPVNLTDVRMVRVEYLFHYKKKIFLLSLIAQLLVTLIAYHKIALANIIYVVVVSIIYPAILGILTIFVTQLPKKR